jgi:hypothetical protein
VKPETPASCVDIPELPAGVPYQIDSAVCHWLCQCEINHGHDALKALAKPVAHIYFLVNASFRLRRLKLTSLAIAT